jgi:putative transposase
MSRGRPRRSVVLSEEDRLQLSAVVRSRSLPHGLVRRAHVVLLAAEGLSNDAIAEKVSRTAYIPHRRGRQGHLIPQL